MGFQTADNAAVFTVMKSQGPVTVLQTLLVPIVNSVCKAVMAMTQFLAVRTVNVKGMG